MPYNAEYDIYGYQENDVLKFKFPENLLNLVIPRNFHRNLNPHQSDEEWAIMNNVTGTEIAVSRLVIQWESSCINETKFGIVKTNLFSLPPENAIVREYMKRKSHDPNIWFRSSGIPIFTFTKAEKTTITDIHVPHPITCRGSVHRCDPKKLTMTIEPMFEDSSVSGIKNIYLQLVTPTPVELDPRVTRSKYVI